MKKIISLFLVFSICFSIFAFSLNASAAVVNKGIITIGKKSANTGDEISIPIDISENPGIMAITISITYNSNSLQYIEYLEGTILKDYTVADHPNKNIIRFVSCESTDKPFNGNLLTLRFKVKDNAEWDFSEISIKYSQGDFCNWNLDKIMPTVISGGVDIAYNGTNCSHKNYGEWQTVAEPTCDSEGVKERICKKCNHVDSKKLAKVGHTYPENWTIEKVATKDEPGTMVRYCISCNNFVDRIEYTIEDSDDGGFNNQVGTEIPKNDIIENNFKEQNPNKEFTAINPPFEQKPDNSSTNENNQNASDNTSSNSSKPSIKDALEGLFGDNEPNKDSESSELTDNNDSSTKNNTAIKPSDIKAKIVEVIPNYEIIKECFKTAFIILILMILL